MVRLILPDEDVHHLNENKLDNRPENLEILTKSNHAKISYKNKQKDKYGKFTIQI